MRVVQAQRPSGYCGVVTLKVDKHPVPKRIFKAFMTFTYLAAGIVAMFSAHEILFGSGAMVHPVWNVTSYNWLPLLSQLTAVAVAGGFAYTLLPRIAPKFLKLTLGEVIMSLLKPLGQLIKKFAVFMTNSGESLDNPAYKKRQTT